MAYVFPIPERDERKPDPAEPWRYVCPDCEGQVHGSAHRTGWYCYKCDRRYYHRRDLTDRARD